jgi:hypothetical protein
MQRDSGIGIEDAGDSFIPEVTNSDVENSNPSNVQFQNSKMTTEAERKKIAEATAALAPFIPVFKTDPLAKIDIKANDINRQIANYNRQFKAWADLTANPDVPNKVWLSVWKSCLSDEALDMLDKLTYEPTDDQDNYVTVAQKLLDHLTKKRGSKYTARVQFRALKQQDKETFASYYQRLQSAAAPCRWTDTVKNENMIEQLISGHRDERVRAILFDLDTDDLKKDVQGSQPYMQQVWLSWTF